MCFDNKKSSPTSSESSVSVKYPHEEEKIWRISCWTNKEHLIKILVAKCWKFPSLVPLIPLSGGAEKWFERSVESEIWLWSKNVMKHIHSDTHSTLNWIPTTATNNKFLSETFHPQRASEWRVVLIDWELNCLLDKWSKWISSLVLPQNVI